MRLFFLFATVVVCAVAREALAMGLPASRSGFPVANFGIGAEVSPAGRLLGRIVYNPPALGEWLEDVTEGYFSFDSGAVKIRDEQFRNRSVSRRWPFARARFSDMRLRGLTVDFTAFAPVARDNPFDSCLPAVFVEFALRNNGDAALPLAISYRYQGRALEEWSHLPPGPGFQGTLGPKFGVASQTEIKRRNVLSRNFNAFVWNVTVPGRGMKRVRILFFRFHEKGYTTIRLRRPLKLVAYAFQNWDRLRAATQAFSDALPRTGDATLDEALRWYMTAGVLLTKLTRDGQVLTMGYTELNQRDSYWTSFVHLVYWPVLEEKMIEESAAAQRADGKIPTTILPVIERNDDIDINCYFALRVFRWVAYRGDAALLLKLWPNVKAALAFVRAMDSDGDGLPEQRSFWADWKDVPGVEGRKYGPHFALLWLAALKHAARWAKVAGDAPAAAYYAALYDKGLKTADRLVSEGGLWGGRYYVNVWRDGRRDDRVPEDQVVGILFGVVDSKRAGSIFAALKGNEGPWGVRETFPYYPETFGVRGGDYHNGAVWPYLNFVDALARARAGRRADAARIMKKVARADLSLHGDYLPHENIDGETGENTRHYIQGWDAAYFAAVYFGLMQPRAKIF